jgi:hypothetical protein
MQRAFVLWALVSLGCTDETVEGRYNLSVTNRDDGCGLGLMNGAVYSSIMMLAEYEDRDGAHLVGVISNGPLLCTGQGLGGDYDGNEVVLWIGDRMVNIDACDYFYGVTLRAEYRPNRPLSLRGRIDYDLVPFGLQPGCSACNSYQEIEGTKIN